MTFGVPVKVTQSDSKVTFSTVFVTFESLLSHFHRDRKSLLSHFFVSVGLLPGHNESKTENIVRTGQWPS